MTLPINISPYTERDIKYIVLHCTATSQDAKVSSIFNFWKTHRKWKNPGYHFMIDKDGTVHIIMSIDKSSNGVKGFNSKAINIAYIGGVDEDNNPVDNRTPKQKTSQIKLLKLLKELYPDAEILGHKDFPDVNKACPCFDVREWVKEVGL